MANNHVITRTEQLDLERGLLVASNAFSKYEEEEASAWKTGMGSCFTSVYTLFGKIEQKSYPVYDWEVPYSAITDLVYLGSGAQGIVYSGQFCGEIVAVKKVNDEAETNLAHLRQLDHDNIVRFRGVCIEAPNFCVIMEYCQYGPLFEFLHNGSGFSPKQVLKWAKEIATGMAYLHANKIIHRDLKSPNILISDDLSVKVSDFGTSREWNNESTIMTFAGTVAWMAPEVIRREPCSERVDVWSYGVVLWELLTQELPFKNLETHAIIWGIGSESISLPIPHTFPDNLQLLLNQCFNRVSKYRPPFKIILAHLDVATEDFEAIKSNVFRASQIAWRQEIDQYMQGIYNGNPQPVAADSRARRDELEHARHVKDYYIRNLGRANDLFMEICSVRLALETREKAIAEREKALEACLCGVARSLRQVRGEPSTTSDVVTTAPVHHSKRQKRANIVVTVKGKNAVKSYALDDVERDNYINNNAHGSPKDTVVGIDGGIYTCPNEAIVANNKKLSEIAHV